MKNELLWKPTSKRIENTSLFQFIKHVNTKHKEKIDSFEALHKWSVENRNYFWDEVWNFYNVIGKKALFDIKEDDILKWKNIDYR